MCGNPKIYIEMLLIKYIKETFAEKFSKKIISQEIITVGNNSKLEENINEESTNVDVDVNVASEEEEYDFDKEFSDEEEQYDDVVISDKFIESKTSDVIEENDEIK